MEKILLIGIGDIGSHILEFAARDDNDYEWIIGDVNKEKSFKEKKEKIKKKREEKKKNLDQEF